MTTKRAFHLGDVLGAYTGRLLSPTGFKGHQAILEFIVGGHLCQHQWADTKAEIQPYLRGWFPWLASDEMQIAIDDLSERLNRLPDRKYACDLVTDWVQEVACGKYGDHGLPLGGGDGMMLEVEQMPPELHERIDPESAMLELRHPDNTLIVIL